MKAFKLTVTRTIELEDDEYITAIIKAYCEQQGLDENDYLDGEIQELSCAECGQTACEPETCNLEMDRLRKEQNETN